MFCGKMKTKVHFRFETGEIYVKKIPSMKITDIAYSVAPNVTQKIIGIRPGEKIHEVLIPEDYSDYTYENNDGYVTFPDFIDTKRYNY